MSCLLFGERKIDLTSILGLGMLPDGVGSAQDIGYPQHDVGGNATGLAGELTEHKCNEIDRGYNNTQSKAGGGILTASCNSEWHTNEGENKTGAGKGGSLYAFCPEGSFLLLFHGTYIKTRIIIRGIPKVSCAGER